MWIFSLVLIFKKNKKRETVRGNRRIGMMCAFFRLLLLLLMLLLLLLLSTTNVIVLCMRYSSHAIPFKSNSISSCCTTRSVVSHSDIHLLGFAWLYSLFLSVFVFFVQSPFRSHFDMFSFYVDVAICFANWIRQKRYVCIRFCKLWYAFVLPNHASISIFHLFISPVFVLTDRYMFTGGVCCRCCYNWLVNSVFSEHDANVNANEMNILVIYPSYQQQRENISTASTDYLVFFGKRSHDRRNTHLHKSTHIHTHTLNNDQNHIEVNVATTSTTTAMTTTENSETMPTKLKYNCHESNVVLSICLLAFYFVLSALAQLNRNICNPLIIRISHL